MLTGTVGQFAANGLGAPLTPTSASHTLDATDHGRIFVIDSNAANITITVPTSLPLGFVFQIVCNSTSKKITVQLSGSERVRYGGNTSGAAGTLFFDGTADTGYSATLAKTSSGFANTYWMVVTNVGTPTLT